MAVIKKNAPRRGINAWREYFQWVEEKGKQGQFRGDLKRLEQLEGPICATSAFSNVSSATKAKELWEKRHPWATLGLASSYTKNRLLTPHHLISCSVMSALSSHYEDVIEADIGYNVNSPQNLVILPNSTAVACHLGVPLHEGGHNDYDISKKDEFKLQRAADSQIDGERVWKPNVQMQAYHAKVFKLVTPIIHKHFRCTKDIDHNEFISDLNKVSKKILRKLGKFQWLLHKDGIDYKPLNSNGCMNTMLISSYVTGRERKSLREISKRIDEEHGQNAPCESHREHPELDEKFYITKLDKSLRRSMGLKVASEVKWTN
ncbi:AHH domain-containing protein [Vibrio jasicida]|uniref:AHH domain-containing protein n=1 Tax=Vibrio jasicida TaxID=766224 RepID=UPI0005EE1C78|nr:AHH domain-containing protein [Vibrio jasicida]